MFIVADELTSKYGRGTMLSEKCPKCGYEVELFSAGVHESESGALRVYADDDQFICPRCIQQGIHFLKNIKTFKEYQKFYQ
jgi:hypothetical protein